MTDSYSLVFNIGSGSITGAIVKFTEKPGIEILSYIDEPIVFQEEVSVTRHLELMKTALASVIKKLSKNNLKIEKAFYLFSTPWSMSQTKTIHIKENKPFKLTDAFLKKIIENEQKKNEISTQNKVIENKIIQVKANGYVVNQFKGEPVSSAEVSLFSTLVPETILKDVEDTISQHFIIKHIWCHSISLPIFSVIRDLFPHRDDFVYLDISEEMTDIAVVKEGVVLSTVSFPFGRNHFLRAISQKLNVSQSIADSMLQMYASKSSDPMASARLTLVISDIINQWGKQVGEVFTKFSENFSLPDITFFITNNDLAAMLTLKFRELNMEVIPLEAKKISSPIKIDDTIFKISLVFLDKIYKI